MNYSAYNKHVEAYYATLADDAELAPHEDATLGIPCAHIEAYWDELWSNEN